MIGPILEKWSAWIVANRELIKQRIDQFINGIVTAVRTAVKIWKAWGLSHPDNGRSHSLPSKGPCKSRPVKETFP